MILPDLVIFDCDGVLIDSEVLANEAFAKSLQKLGVPLTLEDSLKQFVGVSWLGCAAQIEAQYGIKIPDDFWDKMRALEFKFFQEKLEPIPGVMDVLDNLSVKKCVASSSGPRTLEYTLGLTGIWERFAPHVFSGHQVQKGKPAPDLFLFAANQMNARPEGCLVIEDSVPGVRAAKAANMRVYGFTGGSHCSPTHAEALYQEGAEKVFATMADLSEAVL